MSLSLPPPLSLALSLSLYVVSWAQEILTDPLDELRDSISSQENGTVVPANSRKSGTEQNGQGMKREAGRWVERSRNEKDEWTGWCVREGKVLLLDFLKKILIQFYKLCFSSGWNAYLVSTLEGPSRPATSWQRLSKLGHPGGEGVAPQQQTTKLKP